MKESWRFSQWSSIQIKISMVMNKRRKSTVNEPGGGGGANSAKRKTSGKTISWSNSCEHASTKIVMTN